MQSFALLAYAFAVGLTFCGIVGSTIELIVGQRLGFRPPFVMTGRFGSSLALTMATGPFMLTNEAITARRAGAIDLTAFLLCGVAAIIWATALGIVAVELALLAPVLLG